MNISKMLVDSVKAHGADFVAEQKALGSEESRRKSIEAYEAFTAKKKHEDEINSKKKEELAYV